MSDKKLAKYIPVYLRYIEAIRVRSQRRLDGRWESTLLLLLLLNIPVHNKTLISYQRGKFFENTVPLSSECNNNMLYQILKQQGDLDDRLIAAVYSLVTMLLGPNTTVVQVYQMLKDPFSNIRKNNLEFLTDYMHNTNPNLDTFHLLCVMSLPIRILS